MYYCTVEREEDDKTESEDTSSSLTGGAVAGVVIAVLILTMAFVSHGRFCLVGRTFVGMHCSIMP